MAVSVLRSTRPAWATVLKPVVPLAVEPERRRSVAVVEAGVRRVILHRRVPGSHDARGVEIDVVLLLSGILMDVEDDPAARLDVPGAHLLPQHRDDPGVADVARVAALLGHVHAVQGRVRLPGDAERAHGEALVLAEKGRRDVRAVLLHLQLRVDAALLEMALDDLLSLIHI